MLMAAFALSVVAASAQRASTSNSSFFSTEKSDQPITVGIRAGLNSSTIKMSEDNISLTCDPMLGWHAGVIVDFPIMKSFYIQSGLMLQQKGGTEVEVEGYERYETKMDPMYLEIPVLASYRYDFSSSVQLQVNVGPYFAYGISGKEKEEGREENGEYDFFGDSIKKFDMGLSFGAGVTFASHYYVGFAYELGLKNYCDDGDYSLKNNNWMFSVGYNF